MIVVMVVLLPIAAAFIGCLNCVLTVFLLKTQQLHRKSKYTLGIILSELAALALFLPACGIISLILAIRACSHTVIAVIVIILCVPCILLIRHGFKSREWYGGFLLYIGWIMLHCEFVMIVSMVVCFIGRCIN